MHTYVCTYVCTAYFSIFVGSGGNGSAMGVSANDDDPPTVIIIVICVVVIIVIIITTIIIILVVYRIKRKKWPCTNKGKLFHMQ